MNRRSSVSIMGAAALFVVSLAGAQKHAGANGDPAKGKEVVQRCTPCHSDSDEIKYGPSLKGLFKRSKLHNGTNVTAETVRARVNADGGGKPAFGEVLSVDETADLIAYLKTL